MNAVVIEMLEQLKERLSAKEEKKKKEIYENGFSPISFLMAYELEMKRLEEESPSGFKDPKINRSVSN